MSEPVLTTARLQLRPFIASDAPRVHELLSDRRMSETNPAIPWPYELATAVEWIASHAAGAKDGSHLHFAVVQEDLLVGAIDLRVRVQEQRGWLGYWTGTTYWGQGIATEAAQELIEYGFATLRLRRIDAIHVVGNEASRAVMRKLGMHHVQTTAAQAVKGWSFGDIQQFTLKTNEPI